MYKIGVIIPVFNAENTLNRAIDSVLNQKWEGNIVEDIEIVVVDDKSTDNSKKILLEYADKYPNINAIFLDKNSGHPSHPRNVGIKNSNAKYLMFLDNDDEFYEDMCQTLFDTITLKNVDVVTCNWCNIIGSNITGFKLNLNYDKLQRDGDYYIVDWLSILLSNDWMMWRSIYRKSFLINNNISFPLKVCEDVIFLINVFINMDKLIYIPDFYGYKRNFRENSLSAVPKASVILEYLDAFFEVQELLDSTIDFKGKGLDRFYFIREQIDNNLFKIIRLEKTKDINICLDKLYELESILQFDNSLPDEEPLFRIMKVINFFILKKQRKLTILLIRLTQLGLRFMNFFKKN